MVRTEKSEVDCLGIVVSLDKVRLSAAKGFGNTGKLRVFAIAFAGWETAGTVLSVQLDRLL